MVAEVFIKCDYPVGRDKTRSFLDQIIKGFQIVHSL